MHLMGRAIATLREKGFEISPQEATAAKIAILLHDVGHAPFSHTLEKELSGGVSHEEVSLAVMELLRDQWQDPTLDTAVRIFRGDYPKRYLHSLISSQLDMDRLDYLRRDSFFTGASEGIVSHERIIAMMDVEDGEIVFDEKGLYSVEKFVIARRMMYWQVYLHKTVLAADVLVEGIVQRAKELLSQGVELPVHEPLRSLLQQDTPRREVDRDFLERYMSVDESDLWCVFKQWMGCCDFILSFLCDAVVHRHLFSAALADVPPRRAGNPAHCPIDPGKIRTAGGTASLPLYRAAHRQPCVPSQGRQHPDKTARRPCAQHYRSVPADKLHYGPHRDEIPDRLSERVPLRALILGKGG